MDSILDSVVVQTLLLLRGGIGRDVASVFASLVGQGLSLAGTGLVAAIVLAGGVVIGRFGETAVYDWALTHRLDARADETPVGLITETTDAVATAAGLLVKYLIVLLAALSAVRILNISELQALLTDAFGFVPNVIGATILLAVGFGTGRVLRTLVPPVVDSSRLAERFPQTHLGQVLDAAATTVGTTAGRFVEYYVYASAIYVVAVTLTLAPVAALLRQGLTYVPLLAGSSVVLLLGAVSADHFAGIVETAEGIETWAPQSLVSGAGQGFIYLVAIVIALDVAGVSDLLLAVVLLSVTLPIGVGVSLAFGRGGREYVTERLEAE